VHHGTASACNTSAKQKQIPYTLRHGITQLIFVTDQLPYLLMSHMSLNLKISIKKRLHISQCDLHFWTPSTLELNSTLLLFFCRWFLKIALHNGIPLDHNTGI
jgi:hypothetical protein